MRDRPAAGKDCLQAALAYASRGWPVVPLHSIRNADCTCSPQSRTRGPDGRCADAGKHPRWEPGTLEHGVSDATTDAATITRWWTRWPDAPIGIATGAQSGLVALDVDPRHQGDDSLADLERKHGALPATVESLTGGGGRHPLFQHPGVLVANKVAIAPGLDVRGDGGYIVAPPALHVSGRRYAWARGRGPDEVPLAPLPPWLLALMQKPAGTRHTAGEPGARIPEGERNATLASLAGTMRRRGMTETEIAAALLTVNAERCDPPLSEDEVGAIARSIGAYPPGEDHEEKRDTSDDTGEEPRRHRRFLNDLESLALPDIEWLLGGVLPLRNIAFLIAAAGSGKSFVAVDAAFCIATGSPWLGCPVKQGPVVYVEAEGDPEFKYRLLAWKREHGVELDVCGVEFLYEAVDLTDPKNVEEFMTDLRALPEPPVLVVLDTLACCLGTGDENSATDMRLAIENMKRIRREFGCTVWANHHTGHANPDRARGSSAFLGSADTILMLKKDDDLLRLACGKRRGAPFEEITARLDPREVAGQKTAVVKPAGAFPVPAGATLSANQRKGLRTLVNRLDEEGLTYSAWQKRTGIAESTFDDVIRVLMRDGYITKGDGGRGARYVDTEKGRTAIITPGHPDVTPDGVTRGCPSYPGSPPHPYRGGVTGVRGQGERHFFDPLDPECVEGVPNTTPGQGEE